MIEKHTILHTASVHDALEKLDTIAPDAILFVLKENGELLGSLTDGDLRRGFIKNLTMKNGLKEFIQPNPVFVRDKDYAVDILERYRKMDYKVIPVLNNDNQLIDIINFRTRTTVIPADAVLMAGGEGKRLRPLTEKMPKPLLKVGDKPIIEHNIDRLAKVGIKNIHISINYLGEQIESYFGKGSNKNLNIKYVKEDRPMGTIGSILLVKDFEHNDILVMNSDLLTNIDFIDFYKTFKTTGADMAVAATSYNVDIPYAVLETDEQLQIKSLKEKPRYTYYSNAGIYLLKKELLHLIPNGEFFDITDLMNKALNRGLKLITYSINGYWLDIGKHEDFKKAQEDIKHIYLNL